MSAIAGILGLAFREEVIQRMLDTMARRGPDGKGSYHTDEACLLHSRLAVLDLTGGAQPMVLDHGNERYIITYNGELYNTQELRQELMACGHTFDGHSDTEVLLHGYVQWKEGVLKRCNGIFAFAVLEEHSQRLFIARDRIGVKPLFYKMHDGGMLFASEMKTILAYPGVRAELDPEGAVQLLLLGPGRIPGKGVFRGIQELEPGYYGVYEQGKITVTQYWKLQDRIHTDTLDETAEQVRCLILDAIRRQMVSDVPVGCFLSGGLDSSLICAVCARELDARGEYLDTFSLDYEENDLYFQPGKFTPNADTEYIRIMQSYLDSHHHWTVLTPEVLLDNLQNAVIARDLPGMADVDSSLLGFCEQIRPHVKVALSGECADEIFGGYPWYRDQTVTDGFPWAKNTRQRIALMHPSLRQKFDGADYINSVYQDSISRFDVLPENSPQNKRAKQMMQLNFRWFMQTLLDRKDRMSMYHGLAARVPLCDYRIAEYLYTVPWEMKEHRGYEKGLLRYAMRGLLPDAVLYRKKSPFPKTHDPRYTQLIRDRFDGMLADHNAPIFDIVDRNALQLLPDAPFAEPWYGQLMGLPQTMAYMLQINFWLRHYHVSIL